LNCTLYDLRASKQCREPVAESVKEKGKANYCDYFQFARTSPGPEKAATEKSRKDLDDLFRR
jgi:hypothetical protein